MCIVRNFTNCYNKVIAACVWTSKFSAFRYFVKSNSFVSKSFSCVCAFFVKINLLFCIVLPNLYCSSILPIPFWPHGGARWIIYIYLFIMFFIMVHCLTKTQKRWYICIAYKDVYLPRCHYLLFEKLIFLKLSYIMLYNDVNVSKSKHKYRIFVLNSVNCVCISNC